MSATVDEIISYCGIAPTSAAALGVLLPTASNSNIPWATFDSDAAKKVTAAGLPVVTPVGIPIGLRALLPPVSTPGIPLKINSKEIPSGLDIGVLWSVETYALDPTKPYTQDSTDGKTPGNYPRDIKFAKAAVDIFDSAGSFQLMGGNLVSPTFSFIPWPNSEIAPSGGVSSKLQLYVVTLKVRVWLPGITDNASQYRNAAKVYFIVDSWASVFGTKSKIAFWSQGYGTVPSEIPTDKWINPSPSAIFQNLFSMAMSTLTPGVGEAAQLTVDVLEKLQSTPEKVKEIARGTPSVKIQAAVDLSAVLNNALKAGMGLFGGTKASSATNAAEVKIGKLLSSFLSVPVALDINGSTISKVVEPLSIVQRPNLDSLPGGGLAGSVPIGSLNTLLHAPLDAVKLSKVGSVNTTPYKIDPLSQGLGLSILPIPLLTPVMTEPVGSTMEFEVNLQARILLPGGAKYFTVEFYLGDISIPRPMVPLPQMMMFLRHPPLSQGNTTVNTEALIVPDPWTTAKLPGVDQLLDSISSLGKALEVMTRLFPPSILKTLVGTVDDAAMWAGLAYNISAIFEYLSNIPRTSVLVAPLGNPEANGLRYIIDLKGGDYFAKNKWGYDNLDDSQGISMAFWIGCPQNQFSPKWRMRFTGAMSTTVYTLPWQNNSRFYSAYIDYYRGSSGVDAWAFTNVDKWDNQINKITWERVLDNGDMA